MTYKVSSNENPYPPLESVQQVIVRAAATINRYPDMAVTALTARIAEAVGVEPQHVATGTGSVGLLSHVVQAMCDAGDEVVYAWRSFEAYPIVVAVAGAVSVQVPLGPDGRHRLDAMADAVTDRTKVVIVCTPNNPTGPSVTADELDAFLARVPRSVLVVLDEAYLELSPTTPRRTLSRCGARTRTSWCCARSPRPTGWRGCGSGTPSRTRGSRRALRQTATPFGVSSIAQAAAVASLDAYDELQERVRELVAERDRVSAGLAVQGWRLPASQANFVWFRWAPSRRPSPRRLRRAGLVVRRYGDDGVRVTIAEPEANTRLLEVARSFGPADASPGVDLTQRHAG